MPLLCSSLQVRFSTQPSATGSSALQADLQSGQQLTVPSLLPCGDGKDGTQWVQSVHWCSTQYPHRGSHPTAHPLDLGAWNAHGSGNPMLKCADRACGTATHVDHRQTPHAPESSPLPRAFITGCELHCGSISTLDTDFGTGPLLLSPVLNPGGRCL